LNIDISRIGPWLAIPGSIIATVGVLVNNVELNHTHAMVVWVFSNALLMVWAHGFAEGWWKNAVSGRAMCAMYAIMLVSGIYGLLVIYGIIGPVDFMGVWGMN
jgi:hypothetical protein